MIFLAAATILLFALGFVFLRTRPWALAVFIALGVAPLAAGSTVGALITLTLALAILLAQPLYVVLGAVTLVAFEFAAEVTPSDYGIFPEKIFELTDKNVLLAIPFFVVSGSIMTRGGSARRLINFARDLTAWLPGGLAIAAIGGCVLFAAISGSSPVTVIAIGSMMYPTLVKAGFSEQHAIGLLTSAGSLGIVIPPSIPMILYAIVVSGRQVVDVGDLFLAGLGPGLLIGMLLSSYVIWTSLRRSPDPGPEIRRMLKGLAVVATPIVGGEVLALWAGAWAHLVGPAVLTVLAIWIGRRSFVEGAWALMLPVLILGGIYSGYFTPTEAAAVAVVYAVLAEIYVHRELGWGDLPAIIVESTVMMGALIVILVIAFVFNDFMVEAQVPDKLVTWISAMELSRAGFLIAVNILLLFVGCFMDIISAILIVAPLIVPMAMAPGIEVDPVHLGIIFIVNLELGYLTPPLGLNLFVASTLFKQPLGKVIRSVLPFTALMLVGILIITYVPAVPLSPGRWLQEMTAEEEAKSPQPTEQSQPPPGKVLSIEELMQQSGAGLGQSDGESDGESDKDPKPSKSGDKVEQEQDEEPHEDPSD